MAAIVVATAMVGLDATIVTVALPRIGRSLHVTHGIELVVTVYLLAVAAMQPATGWLADHFGRRPVFRASIVAFTIASLGCALSPNLNALIAMRALQGFGGASIYPTGMAMAFELFPRHQHGRAISTWATALTVSPAIGPLLGGWIVTDFSWHWLFTVNVPIGLVAVVFSGRALPSSPPHDPRSLDTPALLLGAVGLAGLVLGLSQGHSWGWRSPEVIGSMAGGILMLVLFTRRTLRSGHPVVDLSLLHQPDVGRMVSLLFLLNGSNYARTVFMPLELSAVRGYSPLRIGLLLMPGVLASAVSMTWGGRLVDRVGLRRPAVVGVALMFVGSGLLATLTTTTSVWIVVLALCLQGGFGFAYAANAVAGMSGLTSHALSQAAALRNVAVSVAGAVAVALFTAVSSALIGGATNLGRIQHGYNVVFALSAALLLPAFAVVRHFPNTRLVANVNVGSGIGVVTE